MIGSFMSVDIALTNTVNKYATLKLLQAGQNWVNYKDVYSMVME
jgi:hypothetical protein